MFDEYRVLFDTIQFSKVNHQTAGPWRVAERVGSGPLGRTAALPLDLLLVIATEEFELGQNRLGEFLCDQNLAQFINKPSEPTIGHPGFQSPD